MKHITKVGIDMIKIFEGFRALPYQDAAGIPTIGYGHVILPGESWTHITEEEGEKELRKDVLIAENAVNRLITVPLEDYQFDALVSFTFNVGERNLARSTLLKMVHAERHQDAVKEFDKWVYAGGKKLKGLIRRRAAEAEMYAGTKEQKETSCRSSDISSISPA